MNLGIFQRITLLDGLDLVITILPVLNRNTKASENEVGRVPRYFRIARLVNVTNMHYLLTPHTQEKCDWVLGLKKPLVEAQNASPQTHNGRLSRCPQGVKSFWGDFTTICR